MGSLACLRPVIDLLRPKLDALGVEALAQLRQERKWEREHEHEHEQGQNSSE
jgi:hypothetical protein